MILSHSPQMVTPQVVLYYAFIHLKDGGLKN